jgi:hypothetical protein
LEIEHKQIEKMAKKTKKQIQREEEKEEKDYLRAREREEATTRYRKCLNHQTLEMLSTVSTISGTETVKVFSNVEYRICSVDEKEHTITLFTNKLWDLILLKLTEVVPYKNRFQWYDTDKYGYSIPGERQEKEWYIYFSIKTIAECLDVSTSADSLAQLYERIVVAAKVVQNISLTVTPKLGQKCKIDGYLSAVGVRDGSDIEGSIMMSNACFVFLINPKLIAYLDTKRPPLYHFNHAWLYFSGRAANAYAVAKQMGRFYSQNTYNCHMPENKGISIGVLRNSLPNLNSKVERDNRVTLYNALQSIPDAFHLYIVDNKKITFDDLTKLRLRGAKYDRIKVTVRFLHHPNTSSNEVTRCRIKDMNDDALLLDRQFYRLEEADELINHSGVLKRPIQSHNSATDVALQDAKEIAAPENSATE